MPVFASTACLGPRDLWATLEAYERAGIRNVELGDTRLDPDDSLAERLADIGLTYLVHNYFPPPADPFALNLASVDPEIGRRSVEHVILALELASRIGSPLYSVHGGFAIDPVGRVRNGFVFPGAPGAALVAEADARFVERVTQLAERADRLGVALLVENNVCIAENRGKLLHQTAVELDGLLAAVPSLAVLVDTGHLNVSASTYAFDRLDFIRQMGDRIGGFHVHENGGVIDEHLPVIEDGWVVGALREVDAARLPVVVEARFDDVDSLAEHIGWLERQMQG